MNTERCRVVAVANEKGGVGKTSTVVNLGAALSLEGKKVLIVDMDPQHNATRGLGIANDNGALTVYDLLKNTKSISAEEVVLKTKWDRLDLIASVPDLAGAEIELVSKIGREYRLKEALENITLKYDFIIIDSPPSLSLLTVNVFSCATEVLVPCQTQPYAYAALSDLFDTIDAIKRNINHDLDITGIVTTFFDKRTRISRHIFEKLKTHDRYRSLVMNTVIRVNTAIAASTGAGEPVVFFKPKCKGSSDYVSLAGEFMAPVFL